MSCASSETLEQLLAGTLADVQAEPLREHLSGCARCRETLDRLSDDPELRRWAAAARGLGAPSNDQEGLRHLLESLRETPAPAASPATKDDTLRGSLGFLGAPEQPGDLGSLGPYRVVAELGRGGMGIVLKAFDKELARTVALKVLRWERTDDKARARFVREARAVAGLDHDHVLPVHTVVNPPDAPPYLVMPFVAGPTLRERILAEHGLEPREAATICLQVAHGLAAAHRAGLIHRDIKPANIILDTEHRRARIMDFGLVRVKEQTGDTTQEGTIPGTPEYMSPEQIRTPNRVDERSDVYSLGVTLYEALTGAVPFRGEPHIVLQQVLHDEPAPPRRLKKSIPMELETILLKAMAKAPAERYGAADELADDLDRFLKDEPIHAKRPGWLQRTRKWARRRRAIVMTAAVGLFLAVAVLAGSLGWIAHDRATRQGKLSEDVQLALQEAQTLRDRAATLVNDNPYQWEGTLAAALLAIKRAQTLADQEVEALDPALRQQLATLQTQLEADEKDRQFVAGFDEIRLRTGHLDLEKIAVKSAPAFATVKDLFRAHGIEADAMPNRLDDAARVRKERHPVPASVRHFLQQRANVVHGRNGLPHEQAVAWIHKRPEPIQQHLVAALDVWLAWTASEDTERQWLVAVLQGADTDSWRTQVRAALLAADWKTVETLLREGEAGGAHIARQRPAFLHMLARRLPPELEATQLSLLRRMQRANPGDFWANEDYAAALTRSNPPQWEEAVRYHTAALALRPRNAGVFLNLGSALRGKGDLDGAIDAYRQGVLLTASNAAAYEQMGRALKEKGDEAGAKVALQKVAQLQAQEVWIAYCLAQAHMTAGDEPAYRKVCADMFARFAKSEDPYVAARLLYTYLPVPNSLADPADLLPLAEVAATNPEYTRLIGAVFVRVGKHEAAIAPLHKGQSRAWDYWFLARAHERLGRMSAARGYVKMALHQMDVGNYPWPERDESQWLRREVEGPILTASVKKDEAVAPDPHLASFYVSQGKALQAKGELDGAAEALDEAVRFTAAAPAERLPFASIYRDLAIAHFNRGQWEKASAESGKATEMGADAADLAANGWQLAWLRMRLGGATEYRRIGLRLLERYEETTNPSFALQAARLCVLHPARVIEPSRAVKLAKHAADLVPDNANFWDSLGLACYRAGDWKGAVAAFEKGNPWRDQTGSVAEWRFVLAMTHWQLGDKQQARKCYDQGVQWLEENSARLYSMSRQEAHDYRDEAADLLGID